MAAAAVVVAAARAQVYEAAELSGNKLGKHSVVMRLTSLVTPVNSSRPRDPDVLACPISGCYRQPEDVLFTSERAHTRTHACATPSVR